MSPPLRKDRYDQLSKVYYVFIKKKSKFLEMIVVDIKTTTHIYWVNNDRTYNCVIWKCNPSGAPK